MQLQFIYSMDPSAPFDITPLVDGTAVTAWVTDFDGLARAYEAYRADDGVQYGIAGVKRILTTSSDSPLAGVGIWAHKGDLANEDLLISTAAFLVSLASGAASCRDSALDCAGVVEANALSDRSGDALVWSVNEVNRSMWPAPEGVLAVNSAALDAAIAAASAAGWAIGSVRSTDLIDTKALELALANLPAALDVNGATWTPLELTLPLD
jgi:NitT/TauT family transport system substrate-binding protein